MPVLDHGRAPLYIVASGSARVIDNNLRGSVMLAHLISPPRLRIPPRVPLAVTASLMAAAFALTWGVGVSLAAHQDVNDNLCGATISSPACATRGSHVAGVDKVAGHRAAPVGPSGLRFYTPPRTLPAGPHGTLIWARLFHGTAALSGARNDLVLYKQVGMSDGLVAVSGIVSIPKGNAPRGGWPVITYAHGATGIADRCAPSQATGPASGAYQTDVGLAPLLDRWIRDGYAVLRTDYEGLGGPGPHPFLIGRAEGHGVLDIVRAARQLDPALSRKVVIVGHSQGGHAALWAAALAPHYTPDLRVLGNIAFAPASHTAEQASLLNTLSTPALTPLAALILRGIDIAYPTLHVRSLLTPAGSKLYPQTLRLCLKGLGSKNSFGGLPLNHLVKKSANLTSIIHHLALNDPNTLKITAPVLLEQGLSDQTVFPVFTQALSISLTGVGDSVTYHTYPGATHSSVLAVAASDATIFLKKHFRH
jgi:pimeloyl-ACP methyl ester carboxylesterase